MLDRGLSELEMACDGLRHRNYSIFSRFEAQSKLGVDANSRSSVGRLGHADKQNQQVRKANKKMLRKAGPLVVKAFDGLPKPHAL